VHISAKIEYACIAVLELAACYGSGEPVRIRTIAESHGIPSRFLVQILLQLKSAGLVTSTRGASGGYQLAKDPREITLGDVMSVVDGQAGEIVSSSTVDTPSSRVLLECWMKVAEVQREMLSEISFADLVERANERSEAMYYI
jgi:Rrf2 family protein